MILAPSHRKTLQNREAQQQKLLTTPIINQAIAIFKDLMSMTYIGNDYGVADGRFHPGLMLPGSEDSAFAGGRFVVDWSTFPVIRAAMCGPSPRIATIAAEPAPPPSPNVP